MLRGIISSWVLLLAAGLHAQSWCPPDAAWTFDYYDQLFGTGVHRIHYTGDTTIEGHQAQRLEHWVSYGGGFGQPEFQTVHWADLYTYEDDGVIYLQGGWPLTFDTLMWFTSAPGDHWGVPEMTDIDFIVLDTSTVLLDDVQLRQLVVQIGPEGWFPVDTLRERIGFQTTYLRPMESLVIDGNYGSLRCYEDQAISFAQPWVTDCGFTMSAERQDKETNRGAYPNPGTDQFTLALLPGPHLLRLSDPTGRDLMVWRVNGPSALIETSNLPSGLYMIRVDEERPLRWLKE